MNSFSWPPGPFVIASSLKRGAALPISQLFGSHETLEKVVPLLAEKNIIYLGDFLDKYPADIFSGDALTAKESELLHCLLSFYGVKPKSEAQPDAWTSSDFMKRLEP